MTMMSISRPCAVLVGCRSTADEHAAFRGRSQLKAKGIRLDDSLTAAQPKARAAQQGAMEELRGQQGAGPPRHGSTAVPLAGNKAIPYGVPMGGKHSQQPPQPARASVAPRTASSRGASAAGGSRGCGKARAQASGSAGGLCLAAANASRRTPPPVSFPQRLPPPPALPSASTVLPAKQFRGHGEGRNWRYPGESTKPLAKQGKQRAIVLLKPDSESLCLSASAWAKTIFKSKRLDSL